MYKLNIVTGENLQKKCDIYIGSQTDFTFNPKIKSDKTKHCILTQISTHIEFDNPYVVFCYSHNIDYLSTIIHLFKNKFILISHNSDFDIEKNNKCVDIILNNNKLVKWYAQNTLFENDKLHFLPIGIANSQWSHGNLQLFNDISDGKFVINKTNLTYFNFNISTNKTKRQICFDKLKNKLTWLNIINPVDNQKRLSTYKFCICPEGNGIDTHRLWECLYLKTVPIVINNEFSNILLKYNIPLVILNDWSDYNENNLNYNSYNWDDVILNNILDIESYFEKLIK